MFKVKKQKGYIMSISEKLSKFSMKRISIFGNKFHMLSFIAIIFFAILAFMNIVSFVSALATLNFYKSLMELLLFSWNTGFLYYNYLLDKLQLEKESKYKL